MANVFIDPLSDGGFKRVFGIEGKSETFLIDFLNGIFESDSSIGRIVSVTYLNNEQPSGNIHGKDIRYDLHCVTSTGHRFIVEMQRDVRPHFEKRAVYYISKAVTDQLDLDPDGVRHYRNLMPVIGLYILETRLHGKGDQIVLKYRFREDGDSNDTIDLTRMVFVQLGNFHKREEECVTAEEQWFYVLKNLNKMEYMPFSEVRDYVFERLGEYARVTNLSKDDKTEYDRLRKFQLDYNSDIFEAREEGLVKGREEGLVKGREEGEALGEARGIAKGENLALRMIATKMKQQGESIDRIINLTGLTEEEINAL